MKRASRGLPEGEGVTQGEENDAIERSGAAALTSSGINYNVCSWRCNKRANTKRAVAARAKSRESNANSGRRSGGAPQGRFVVDVWVLESEVTCCGTSPWLTHESSSQT